MSHRKPDIYDKLGVPEAETPYSACEAKNEWYKQVMKDFELRYPEYRFENYKVQENGDVYVYLPKQHALIIKGVVISYNRFTCT